MLANWWNNLLGLLWICLGECGSNKSLFLEPSGTRQPSSASTGLYIRFLIHWCAVYTKWTTVTHPGDCNFPNPTHDLILKKNKGSRHMWNTIAASPPSHTSSWFRNGASSLGQNPGKSCPAALWKQVHQNDRLFPASQELSNYLQRLSSRNFNKLKNTLQTTVAIQDQHSYVLKILKHWSPNHKHI